MKLLTTVLVTVATAFPQLSGRLPLTDAEKIADALRWPFLRDHERDGARLACGAWR